jgi:hypothetical protein
MNKKILLLMIFTALALGLNRPEAIAQAVPPTLPAPTVFASGLKAPTKSIVSPKGNLLVAEQGNGANTGRISIFDFNGNRRTLLDGLPSAIAPPEGAPSGPAGLAFRGRTLFVVIGQGDATMAGLVPGTEVPNPNPSSPFLSSVLSLRLSPQAEETTQGFTMTFADQLALQSQGFLKLADGLGNQLIVELLTNFPNFTAEFPSAVVRPSNPFGIAIRGNTLYVVDAGQNKVYEVDADSGATRTLITFPRRANPLPFGPPVIDPVPNSIRVFGKSLLVSFLTGFPFPAGTAEVRRIRLANTADEPFIGGLSSAIDVLPGKNLSNQDIFYTLEFSTNMLAENTPGRLSRFDQLGGSQSVRTTVLVSPTSLAQDPVSGDLFVTEIFTGRIMRVAFP